jgi:RNA polymerase sigma-70 factor, ECF subfamily
MVGAEAAAVAPKPVVPVWKDAGWPEQVRRIAAGDSAALARLYDESCRLVYSVALRIVADRADAEEVTLDVYTQIWQQAGQFTAERGTVTAWLVMLARSRAIDKVRSRGKRRRTEEPLVFTDIRDESNSPEHEAGLAQKRRVVQSALASLSPEQRQAVELAYFSGLTHYEQAERLGLPLGTVKTRIRLGMMKLRELLGDLA